MVGRGRPSPSACSSVRRWRRASAACSGIRRWDVVNGDGLKFRRVGGRSDLSEVYVEPDTDAAVSLGLPATTACTESGAVCTSDGMPQSNGIALTVPGRSSTSRSRRHRAATPQRRRASGSYSRSSTSHAAGPQRWPPTSSASASSRMSTGVYTGANGRPLFAPRRSSTRPVARHWRIRRVIWARDGTRRLAEELPHPSLPWQLSAS